MFRIVVPLDDNYSFDAETSKKNKAQVKAPNEAINEALTEALNYVSVNPSATQKQMCDDLGKSRATVQRMIKQLQDKGLLEREGAKKNGRWIVK